MPAAAGPGTFLVRTGATGLGLLAFSAGGAAPLLVVLMRARTTRLGVCGAGTFRSRPLPLGLVLALIPPPVAPVRSGTTLRGILRAGSVQGRPFP